MTNDETQRRGMGSPKTPINAPTPAEAGAEEQAVGEGSRFATGDSSGDVVVGSSRGEGKPLKVWGWQGFIAGKQVRHIVAAPSFAAAQRAAKAAGNLVTVPSRAWASESGNPAEVETATASPGTIFHATSSLGKDFRPYSNPPDLEPAKAAPTTQPSDLRGSAMSGEGGERECGRCGKFSPNEVCPHCGYPKGADLKAAAKSRLLSQARARAAFQEEYDRELATLTRHTVEAIERGREAGLGMAEIAEALGVSRQRLYQIVASKKEGSR